jgi:hypothetical protein
LEDLRWIAPETELEEAYPEGKPGFHPFPTVTEVVYAAFCPRAAYHHILHALDPFTPPHWEACSGEKYHKLICLLEQAMAEGEEVTLQRVNGLGCDLIGPNWKYCRPLVKSWWERIRPERKIEKGEELFFELEVSGRVRLEGISGKLYLRGKVDEIDKTKKLIVERTTKDRELALAQKKDLQLWLLQQILKGIGDEDRPEELRGEDFGSYRLILETPQETIRVEDNPEYRDHLLMALRWIRNITTEDDPIVTWREVFTASRECSPSNKKKGCELSYICFQKGHSHPPKKVRNRMRVNLAQQWKDLRWETMWEHDLYEYRLARLPPQKLQDMGITCGASVVGHRFSTHGLEVEVELPDADKARQVGAEAKRRGIKVLLYGTLKMGLREEGKMLEVEGRRMRLFFEGVVPHRVPKSILFVSSPSALVLTGEEPVYLERRTQEDVYRYSCRGTSDENKAKRAGQFALLEAIFGERRVVRG